MQLIDQYLRKVNYLRVSVTDRCDLRCVYCMKEKMQFLPRKDILTLEEIERLCDNFIELGVEKNIEFEENNAEEIKDLAEEMNSRIDKNWVNNNDEEYLQKRYRQIVDIKSFDNTDFHAATAATDEENENKHK